MAFKYDIDQAPTTFGAPKPWSPIEPTPSVLLFTDLQGNHYVWDYELNNWVEDVGPRTVFAKPGYSLDLTTGAEAALFSSPAPLEQPTAPITSPPTAPPVSTAPPTGGGGSLDALKNIVGNTGGGDGATGPVNFTYGGGGSGGAGASSSWDTGDFAATLPGAAWMRTHKLPGTGRNPFQEWLMGQAMPAFASYKAGQLTPGATPVDFDPSQAPSTWGAGALGALGGMRGQAGDAQEAWIDEMGGNDMLSALVQSALGRGGKGFSAPIANILARRVDNLKPSWQAETFGGKQGDPWLTYLMQKLGL